MVWATAKDVPVRVVRLLESAVPMIPSSAPAVEPFQAATESVPPLSTRSVTTITVRAVLRQTFSRGLASAKVWKTSRSVNSRLRST